MNFKTIGIAGAGTMGIGIAQVSAMNNCKVKIYDSLDKNLISSVKRITENLEKGVSLGKVSKEVKQEALENIIKVNALEELQGDLIIEAVYENLSVKQEILQTLEKNNDENCILASNTSSIPITQIASCLKRPENFIGIHFFNPAHIMKLVEIIKGVSTNQNILEKVKEWVKSIGKTGVVCEDSPGFIVNRVARSFYTESLKSIEEKASNFEDLDDLLEATGFKMGPFKLMDLIGIDTNYSVTSTIYSQFNHELRFRPSRLQKRYIDAGWYGKKSGKGFYNYE